MKKDITNPLTHSLDLCLREIPKQTGSKIFRWVMPRAIGVTTYLIDYAVEKMEDKNSVWYITHSHQMADYVQRGLVEKIKWNLCTVRKRQVLNKGLYGGIDFIVAEDLREFDLDGRSLPDYVIVDNANLSMAVTLRLLQNSRVKQFISIDTTEG